MGVSVRDDHRVVTFDQIATDLQELRAAAGNPSYSDLVHRVEAVRVARGVPAERARPARSTLYDAFRTGRRRIDERLVADLVLALGAEAAEAADWVARCRRAVPADTLAAPAEVERVETITAVEPLDPAERVETVEQVGASAPRLVAGARRRRTVALVLLGSIAINLIGRKLSDGFELSLYLDMVGTAITAVALGPWWGVGVGVTTNVLGVGFSGWHSLPFILVQVGGALVWGYGVHRFGMGRSMSRFLGLNVLVAIVCTAIAAPILLLLYGGGVGHGSEDIVAGFMAHGQNLVTAVFSANAVTSVSDKMISGFITLAALDALRRHLPLAQQRVAPASDLMQPRVWFLDQRLRAQARWARPVPTEGRLVD